VQLARMSRNRHSVDLVWKPRRARRWFSSGFPGKGHRREDLTPQTVLFRPVRSYQIIYRPESTPLEIVAVLHGKRNIKRILQKR
jgi:hypothetical protein